jgi:uncharacterized protein
MNKVLILHAWYSKPEDNWYSWLKKELEIKGNTVSIPLLPTLDSNLPDLQKCLSTILFDCGVTRDTIIIGHSIGCLIALRLAERMVFKSTHLVAGWDFNDLTKEHKLFWKTPIDHEKIKRNVHEIYCYSSNNDPYMTAFQVEEMSKRLNGKFILIKGKGHFTTKDGVSEIPELLQNIQQ